MRPAVVASLLLHGAVIMLLLFELPRSLPEPDESPGLEVMLGAVQAPGQGQQAAAPPLPAVEEPPELEAAAAPPMPPAPPTPVEQPVVRPLFGDSLADLMPGAPGTNTEGELIPAREVPGIRNPLPVYPEAARMRGQQGSVGVRLRIDADGTVLRVEVIESSGFPLLDQAVVEALRRWRFAPAMQAGQPVAADFLHRTTFRLD